MSMPSFPPNGADMTLEEALTMIIASIAMEELALSHILNAEGEKLQYILGTRPCAAPQDVLAVNQSVTALVEAVMQNQILLKNKLSQVLAFCPPPPPCKPEPSPCPPPCRPCPPSCPPPCPPDCPVPDCGKSAVQLAEQRERMLWSPACCLPWKLRSRSGCGIGWDERDPAQVRLEPGKIYMVQYTLNVCAAAPVEGAVRLKPLPCGAVSGTLPLYFSIGCPPHSRQTLHQVSVIHPCGSDGCRISLILDAKAPVCVERAVMNVVELG